MSRETDDRQEWHGPGGASLAIFVICWILFLVTGCIAANYYLTLMDRPPVAIPQFLIDVFVGCCQIAVGCSSAGTALGVAAWTVKKLSKKNKEKSE